MDAAQALAELTDLSSQVERAVVLEEGGEVLGATDDDPAEAQALAGAALALVAAIEHQPKRKRAPRKPKATAEEKEAGE